LRSVASHHIIHSAIPEELGDMWEDAAVTPYRERNRHQPGSREK
jgi:hypothetical protein